MYIPDEQNAKQLQISNDAFFYLLNEEEPLGEDNLEEAEEILGMFPNGFIIKEGWSYVDEDLVEATFVPYTKDTHEYDLVWKLSPVWQKRLKWIDNNNIRVWDFNTITGQLTFCGEFQVLTNQYGLRYFEVSSAIASRSSMYFLKHFIRA